MTEFLYFYYYYNRSCLTNLRVSRISDPIILGPRQNIGITHVFHALTFAGSQGSCLNTRPLGPRDPASINAMKQT